MIKQFKLGFGPMSKEIVEILASRSKQTNTPLMIIASRNQVDASTGYVCTSDQLADMIAPYKTEHLLLCRDHCGPYFADLDRGLDLAAAMERCKETIRADVAAGFDLIHIDVSKVPADQLARAKELIDFTLSLNPNIMLEFGSEDNTGVDLAGSIGRIEPQLEFLEQYKNNVKFFVTQTGSLTKDKQMGSFDLETNKEVAKKIHAAGLLFKEHNADYFTADDLTLRSDAGVDSLNIAPQLGKIQTDLLKEIAPSAEWQQFADYVYSKGNWRRWVNDEGADRDNAVSVAGHYCFNSDAYDKLVAAIDKDAFNAELGKRINALVDFYKKFEEECEFRELLKRRLEELRKRDPFIYR